MTWKDGTIEDPLNREPSPETLTSEFISEKDVYDRNHGGYFLRCVYPLSGGVAVSIDASPILHIDASTHVVHVDGAVDKPLQLTMTDLQSYPQHTITAALQCAGNRRHTMRTKVKEVWGLDWNDGAVMNCHWSGPLLRDILRDASPLPVIDESTYHVAFGCHQTAVEDDDYYGGSIPYWRAINADYDVLLALEMNGHPLTPERGFPVRVIVPGVAGARAVKWLDRITVQDHESSNKYQQRDYKILPPDVQTKEQAEEVWHQIAAFQEIPINSVITSPQEGDVVKKGQSLVISGYALPQGDDGPIVKVEVSVDEGKIWKEAKIPEKGSKWSWVLWEFVYDGPIDEQIKFWSRATDTKNQQTEGRPWNLRGVGYNGYGELGNLKTMN